MRMVPMTQALLAYVTSDVTDGDVVALNALAASMAQAETWTVGPPRFVDEVDDSSGSKPEDEPVRTMGIVLPVSSPGAIPETPVSEPERFLAALADLSRARKIDFEVLLDDTYVGEISSGEMDRLLRDGLLAQW
jgi:hypothetical protein